jgi:hypothetical protein
MIVVHYWYMGFACQTAGFLKGVLSKFEFHFLEVA